MRRAACGLVLVGVVIGCVSASAQSRLIPPPNAGTHVIGSSGYIVTARSGWPEEFPDLWPRPSVGDMPLSWPVITITATPSRPTGDRYGVRLPPSAAEIRVWDRSAGSFEIDGREWTRANIQHIRSHRFPVTLTNAIGGTFQGQGILAVLHAGHVPDSVQVLIRSVGEDYWERVTLQVRPVRR